MDIHDLLLLNNNEKYHESMFTAIERLQRINLDYDETAILAALEMLFTGEFEIHIHVSSFVL